MVRSWDARVRGAAEKAAPHPADREPELSDPPADEAADAPTSFADVGLTKSSDNVLDRADVGRNTDHSAHEGLRGGEGRETPVQHDRILREPVQSEPDQHDPSPAGADLNVGLGGSSIVAPVPTGHKHSVSGLGSAAGADNDSAAVSPNPDVYARVEGFDFQAMSQIVIEGQATAIDLAGLSMAIVNRDQGSILWRSAVWTEQFGPQELLSRLWPSSTDLGESPLPADGESWKRVRSMVLADGDEELIELSLAGSSSEQGVAFVTVLAAKSGAKTQQIADRGEVIGIIEGAMQLAAAEPPLPNEAGSKALHESVQIGQPSGLAPEQFTQTLAVLYIDLDRFKVVHDLVGNLEALRLLDVVGRRIRSAMRESDLFFRLPSDEFVVIATDLDSPSQAEELAERVRTSVATLSDLGHDMALTASVGIALVEAGQSGDQLLAAAETAVYLAKGRGRNRVAVHDEELRARSQRLLVVERHLRRAIDRKDVRFAYQPVVNLSTGEVIGAEALLRLGGEVGLSAIEVIQAAEHSGLMGALGSLVVEGVNEQLSTLLRDRDEEFVVMVNLSGTQLQDPALLAVLGRLALDPTIPAGRLAVEVPEAVVDQNRAAFLQLCEVVRPSFKIGVDGFGTTLASDAILESLPIDYVKLHRTVTANAAPEGAGRVRAQQLVELATSRGIITIALGVEGVEQVSILHSSGCLIGQGFLYAGAVAAPELLELVEVGFDAVAPLQESGRFSDW